MALVAGLLSCCALSIVGCGAEESSSTTPAAAFQPGTLQLLPGAAAEVTLAFSAPLSADQTFPVDVRGATGAVEVANELRLKAGQASGNLWIRAKSAGEATLQVAGASLKVSVPAPAFTIQVSAEQGLGLTEGASKVVRLSLDGDWGASKTVRVRASNQALLSVEPSELTWTAEAKTFDVTLTAIDNDDEGNASVDVTFTAQGAAPVTKTIDITDNDSQQFVLQPTSLQIEEGGDAGSFTVSLTRELTASIDVSLTSKNNAVKLVPSKFTLSKTSKTQVVRVSVAMDNNSDDTKAEILVSSPSVPHVTLALEATDGKESPLIFETPKLRVDAGSSATNNVRLREAQAVQLTVATAPSGITITPNPIDAGAESASFKVAASASAQSGTVTLRGGGMEGSFEVVVRVQQELIVSSNAPISLNTASGEDSASISVRLSRAPVQDVSIAMSTNTPDVSFLVNDTNRTLLNFTPENYSTPQQVVVRAAQGDSRSGTLRFSMSGTTGMENTEIPDDVFISIDIAGPPVVPQVLVSPPHRMRGTPNAPLLRMMAGGPSVTLQVSLSRPQSGNPTVTVSGMSGVSVNSSQVALTTNEGSCVVTPGNAGASGTLHFTFNGEHLDIPFEVFAGTTTTHASWSDLSSLGLAGAAHTQLLSWDAENDRLGFVVRSGGNAVSFARAVDRSSGSWTRPTPSTLVSAATTDGYDVMTRLASTGGPSGVLAGTFETGFYPPQTNQTVWRFDGGQVDSGQTSQRGVAMADDGAILSLDSTGGLTLRLPTGTPNPPTDSGLSTGSQLSLIRRPAGGYTMLYVRQTGSDDRRLTCATLSASGDIIRQNDVIGGSGAELRYSAVGAGNRIVVVYATGTQVVGGWSVLTVGADCAGVSTTAQTTPSGYLSRGMPQLAYNGDRVLILVEGDLSSTGTTYDNQLIAWSFAVNPSDGTLSDPGFSPIGVGRFGSVVWAEDRWIVGYFAGAGGTGHLTVVSGSFRRLGGGRVGRFAGPFGRRARRVTHPDPRVRSGPARRPRTTKLRGCERPGAPRRVLPSLTDAAGRGKARGAAAAREASADPDASPL